MSKTTKRSLLYALGLLVLIAFAMWLRYASRSYFHSPAVNYLRSAIYLFLFSVLVLLSLGAHRTGAGAALHAGDFGADGAVDSAALNQVFH